MYTPKFTEKFVAKRKNKRVLKIAHFASEAFPYSKTGGMAHAVVDMAKSVNKLGHEVTIFTPLYGKILKRFRRLKLVAQDLHVKIDDTTTQTFSAFRGELSANGNTSGRTNGGTNGKVTIYFISHYEYFGRYSRNYYAHPEIHQHFYFFNLASLALIKQLKLKFDLIQCHDWMSALTPYILRYRNPLPFRSTPKTLLTIHNLGFQGSNYLNEHRFKLKDKVTNYDKLPLYSDKKSWNKINFLRRGIKLADAVSTVSPNYASEIVTPDYGEGVSSALKRRAPITGIINGIDHKYFDPATSEYLAANYNSVSWEKGKRINKRVFFHQQNLPMNRINWPLVVMTQRITFQKGFDLIVDSLEELTARQLILVIMGNGIGEYEQKLKQFKPDRKFQFCFINSIDEQLEQRAISAADMILLPSRYEPCGTAHLKAMRYGVIPIARSTGGLTDTISDYSSRSRSGTGFLFTEMERADMLGAIDRSLELYNSPADWRTIVKRVMNQPYTWDLPALEYEHFYKSIISQ